MSACSHCDAAVFRLGNDHVRVSERGVEVLAPCTADDEVTQSPADPTLARLSEVTARMRQGYAAQAAAEILAKSRAATHLEQSQPEEEDDDGEA